MKIGLIKVHLVCTLIAVITTAYSQAGKFHVYGNLSNAPALGIVYLLKGETPSSDASKWIIIDSVKASKGKFHITGSVPQPDFYCIVFKDNKRCPFILENGQPIYIDGDYNNLLFANVKGTKNNLIYKALIKKQEPLIGLMNAYADSAGMALDKKDTALYDKYASLNQKMAKNINDLNVQNIKENSRTFFSLDQMQHYYTRFSKEEIRSYYNNLPAGLKNTSQAKILFYKVFKSNNGQEKASLFYDFPLIDTSYREISYNNFLGNYVLLDFWASWCKPCIKNLPDIKNIYSKFGNKNFKIISVSLDENSDSWKKQVIKDSSGWLQVSDLKGWQGLPVKFFKIDGIPRYVLLDTTGKVINDNLKIKEIENTLTTVLGQ